MYTNYWHLRTTPFLNVIDRKLLFPAEQHEEAIARYTFLAESGRLAGTLTGPYGVGKSTVLKHVVAEVELRTKIPVIRMDAIPDGYLPMAQQILSMMGIDGPNQTFPDALMAFWYAAERHPESVQRTLLCIDDANYLGTQEGLYFINYLTNIRIQDPVAHTEQPMFTIILAGNPQLNEIIHNHPSLVQRIQMMYHLEPFTAAQTTEYVRHHIAAVGGDPGAFHPDALESIFKYSGGLPRKINTLCDTALMLGFAARAPQVSAEIVNQAATDTGVFSPQAVPPKESDR